MLKQLLFIPVFCAIGSKPVNNGSSVPQLQKGFKLEAAGKAIECTMGHAAPFVVDFDGDGRKDIVVGEFGGESKGRARVYLNTGTNDAPKFDTFTYLKAGGRDAFVEPMCCIGFDPYFVDLNGDGILDVTSGDYTSGYIHFYEGTGKKALAFKEAVNIPQPELDDSSAFKDKNMKWYMRTANFADFDGDKDFDMIWGNVKGGVFYTENVGTKKKPRFAKSIPMTVDGIPMRVDSKSDPYPVDWDGDGIIDLLVGSESGDIIFFKGKKKASTDFEPGVSVWTGKKIMADAVPGYNEVVKSLEELGENAPYRKAYRVRLAVTDWNNDGKLDLLVGDCYQTGINQRDKTTSGNIYVFLRK